MLRGARGHEIKAIHAWSDLSAKLLTWRFAAGRIALEPGNPADGGVPGSIDYSPVRSNRGYRNDSVLQVADALTGLQRAVALPGRVTTKCPGQRAGSLTG